MTEPVYIARCKVHGLHVKRALYYCDACGRSVEQVAMIPVENGVTEEMIERAAVALAKAWAEQRPGQKPMFVCAEIEVASKAIARRFPGVGLNWWSIAAPAVDALIAMQGGDAR